MATDKVILRDSKKAAFEGLEPSKQFFLVKITTSDTLELAASGDIPFPLLDTPKSGEGATIAMAGIAKVKLVEEVKEGQLVASNNSGEGQVAATGQKIVGIALHTAKAGGFIDVLLSIGAKA